MTDVEYKAKPAITFTEWKLNCTNAGIQRQNSIYFYSVIPTCDKRGIQSQASVKLKKVKTDQEQVCNTVLKNNIMFYRDKTGQFQVCETLFYQNI